MLSEQEKKELVTDGLSESRKADFRKVKKLQEESTPLLKDYLKFLSRVQKCFSSVTPR